MDEKEIVKELISEKKKYSVPEIKERFNVSDVRARQIVYAVSIFSDNVPENKSNPVQTTKKKKEAVNTPKKGITAQQLRSKYDNHFIVKQKAQSLEAGLFFTNSDFVSMCAFPGNSGYREALEHPDFENYHGKAGGNVYWGHPDSISKLKQDGVLR